MYALVKEGKFPAPIPLGEESQARGWLLSQVNKWVQRQYRATVRSGSMLHHANTPERDVAAQGKRKIPSAFDAGDTQSQDLVGVTKQHSSGSEATRYFYAR